MGVTVSSGQTSNVTTVATSDIVLSGGRLIIDSGGTANQTVLSGGAFFIDSRGSASGTIISSGGVETVSGHGVDFSAHVSSGGTQLDFGLASAVTVLKGGSQVIESGGSASGSIISSGGAETVSAHGTDFGAQIFSSGTQTVASGGIASGVTLGGALSCQTVFVRRRRDRHGHQQRQRL